MELLQEQIDELKDQFFDIGPIVGTVEDHETRIVELESSSGVPGPTGPQGEQGPQGVTGESGTGDTSALEARIAALEPFDLCGEMNARGADPSDSAANVIAAENFIAEYDTGDGFMQFKEWPGDLPTFNFLRDGNHINSGDFRNWYEQYCNIPE